MEKGLKLKSISWSMALIDLLKPWLITAENPVWCARKDQYNYLWWHACKKYLNIRYDPLTLCCHQINFCKLDAVTVECGGEGQRSVFKCLRIFSFGQIVFVNCAAVQSRLKVKSLRSTIADMVITCEKTTKTRHYTGRVFQIDYLKDPDTGNKLTTVNCNSMKLYKTGDLLLLA